MSRPKSPPGFVAVAVMVFAPTANGTDMLNRVLQGNLNPAIKHSSPVSCAVPLPPAELLQVTEVAVAERDPETVTVSAHVWPLFVGDSIVISPGISLGRPHRPHHHHRRLVRRATARAPLKAIASASFWSWPCCSPFHLYARSKGEQPVSRKLGSAPQISPTGPDAAGVTTGERPHSRGITQATAACFTGAHRKHPPRRRSHRSAT